MGFEKTAGGGAESVRDDFSKGSDVGRGRGAVAIGAALLSLGLLAVSAEGASLAVIRERGSLHVCAHPDALPFSSQDRVQPGLQLEIADALAKHLGVRVHVDWIVFTRHARRVECDALIGSILQGGEAASGRRRGPRLSKPYAGGGYLLVVPKTAAGITRVEDVTGGKIGVEHTSWPHYLFTSQKVPTASFVSQTEIIEGVARGEIAAGMVTGAYLGWYLKEHPDASVKAAEGYVSSPELQWNVAVGLRNADEALVDAVNAALDRLLADGTIQAIFSKYGIAYVSPHRL